MIYSIFVWRRSSEPFTFKLTIGFLSLTRLLENLKPHEEIMHIWVGFLLYIYSIQGLTIVSLLCVLVKIKLEINRVVIIMEQRRHLRGCRETQLSNYQIRISIKHHHHHHHHQHQHWWKIIIIISLTAILHIHSSVNPISWAIYFKKTHTFCPNKY